MWIFWAVTALVLLFKVETLKGKFLAVAGKPAKIFPLQNFALYGILCMFLKCKNYLACTRQDACVQDIHIIMIMCADAHMHAMMDIHSCICHYTYTHTHGHTHT